MPPSDPPRSAHRAVTELRVVTYNVHRCRGMDGGSVRNASRRCWPPSTPMSWRCRKWWDRDSPGPDMPRNWARALGMGWIMAPARELRRHQFGNVVLSRLPIREHARVDLSWKTCEPRCAQRVEVEIGGTDRCTCTTRIWERRSWNGDTRRRGSPIVLDRRVHGPKLVLGDFNEWGRGLVADALAERLNSVDLHASQAPPDLSRASFRSCISTTSTSRGTSRSAGGAAALATRPDCLGPPAARRRAEVKFE